MIAFAEERERFKEIFVLKEANEIGLYAFNVYVRGRPYIIVIDDYIPFMNGGTSTESMPVFANIGIDGALWGPLIEKVWAKINGNYEHTAAGWQHEALRIFSGAPSYDYLTASYDTDQIWEILSSADLNDYIIGAGTSGSGNHDLKNAVGLSQSHAYSVLGTYELVDASGEQVYRLLMLRNPWGFETFRGKWNDKDPLWLSGGEGVDYKEQVPYYDLDDGKFFIDMDTFKESFLYFLVQYYRPGWIVSFYEQLDDDSTLRRYHFTTTETMSMHLASDTYDPRMYPYGCKSLKVMAQMLVRKVDTKEVLAEKYFSDWIGFGHIYLSNLPAGHYEIYLQYAWPEGTSEKPEQTVHDYTVRIYAPQKVTILDSDN